MSIELPTGCRLLPLSLRGDDRGRLIAIEANCEVPFAIARVYYIYKTAPSTTRGLHAHRRLNQLAVAVSGSCTMLLDDGKRRVEMRLTDPTIGLSLPPLVWHEMSNFSADCVLMVLADAAYDEGDYIRNYADFRALTAA